MNLVQSERASAADASRLTGITRLLEKRPSFRPLFMGDWIRAVFIHYEVDPRILQREVPFELDIFDGRAFVSLVAFTMKRLRPAFGGGLAALLFTPIANHSFLNVRTYVQNQREAGIYFIAEFVSNLLCVPLGPRTFGLPYRLGRMAYQNNYESGVIAGEINATGRLQRLSYKTERFRPTALRSCEYGTLDAFLLERYTAFTRRGSKRRFFRIWHSPWLQSPVQIAVEDRGLLALTGRWVNHARLAGAHFSPGVQDVWMERPHIIPDAPTRRRSTVFFDV